MVVHINEFQVTLPFEHQWNNVFWCKNLLSLYLKFHLSHGISMDVKWPIEEFTYESNVEFCSLNLFFRWDVWLQMNLNPNVELVASWIKWQFSTMENHVYFVWMPTFLPMLTCPIYNIWKDTCFKRCNFSYSRHLC